MTRYANVDKLVKAGYNMLSNDLEQHDPIDWILAELDGFVIEVPTPHGRLIDADEFLDRAIGTQCFRGVDALMLEELIGESTTIIPAEEGK